ncbi:MAG: DNA recombination protein RmuC [Cyclobacteriaceae bacterium]|jgi:DNA recombination protein RmuC|nr:DNA recombination protein RmuC [Cyclobacteriaceae bacterium]
MEIVYLLAGGVLGGVLGWFMARSRSLRETHGQAGQLVAEQERGKSLEAQLTELKRLLDAERNRVLALTNSLASTEADYRNLEEKLEERKLEFADMQERFTAQFKNLANDIFEEKSKRFTEQNKTNLFDLLKPLGEKIVAFEKKVEDTHKDSISRNAALREQLENLQRLNVQMTREAENLTRALKGDSQAQGAWGEFILESILEKSGLERDREYSIQESFSTAEGRLRPDVIIRLPENRHVIIDSKVSLKAYNAFVNAENETDKATALKAHLLSIRQHMKGLADKNYQKNITENGLDFIILFIPIEPAYILAIQSEKGLYEEALEKRIVFVSPTLLIPSLQLIKNVWKQEYQNRHVLDIANKAGDLYDKFVGFTEDLITLGRHLETSKKYYEESMKKLSVGSGNLVRKVEDLKKLGAKASKTIDSKLLGRSEEQADLFE